MSNIVNLEVENVKRIKAVRIKPDGTVVIGGKNGAGKSSVIDAIEFALGGKPSAEKPIRTGTESAKVVVELDDFTITRRFTSKGSRLEITTSNNGIKSKISSPQVLLDELCGKLTFDPCQFATMSPKAQADILRDMTGVDVSEIDAKRKEVYDNRTVANKNKKTYEARLQGMTFTEGLPNNSISVAELSQQLIAAEKHNNSRREKERQVEKLHNEYNANINQINILEDKIVELKQLNLEIENQGKEINKELKLAFNIDTTALQQQIGEAESTNEKIRNNENVNDLRKQLAECEIESNRYTKQIEDLDAKKVTLISTAAEKLPIPGLTFDSESVYYNGEPFSQCSQGEQIRVSVAIGMALNPKLKILLIRNGSLMDADNMAIVKDTAAKEGYQLWIERVAGRDAGGGKPADCSVFIEDGEVAE